MPKDFTPWRFPDESGYQQAMIDRWREFVEGRDPEALSSEWTFVQGWHACYQWLVAQGSVTKKPDVPHPWDVDREAARTAVLTLDDLTTDPTASDRLRMYAVRCLNADPTDALNETEVLFRVLQRRASEALKGSHA